MHSPPAATFAFTPIGTPANGRLSPGAIASASASACSASSSMNAPICRSIASIRRSAASTASRALSEPSRIRMASSCADMKESESINGPRAVDGIDLEVAPGEVYGFLGPNGAGKSTTVLMLTTLLPPTAGRATVAGFDVVREGPKVREAIGAALQEAALDPLLTGREHLRLQTALHDLPRAERRARAQELLERVGLTRAADRKVKGYSGGMKRRLDLALALVHRPRIL